MLYLEKKWAAQIGVNLDRFTWKTSDVANFRCNICGDSKTNLRKARAYFYPIDNTLAFRCHNCGASMSLSNYIKQEFPQYYPEYVKERFEEKASSKPLQEFTHSKPKDKQAHKPVIDINRLTNLLDLADDHPAILYVKKRKIPDDAICHIYFTENFGFWVATVCPGKYDKIPTDKRLVFPIYDKTGERIIGAQARALEKDSKIRYITLKFDDDESKIYGRENLNTSYPILVTEGPIDSLFLKNAIALCGGDISYDLQDYDKSQITIILDNEPRSPETLSRYEKAISNGFSIVVWHGIPSRLKDINDMILDGFTIQQVQSIIDKNTFSGMKAKLEFAKWKKQ